MFCDEALDAVEAIAAGELTPDGRIGEHLVSCPNCAAALDAARRLERLLQARPVPKVSAQFTPRTMAKVRRARWRSDQFLDLAFNLAIGVVVLAIVAGVYILMHRTGLTAVSNDLVDLFSTGFVALAHRVGPSVPLYAAATALLAGALGIWWWAERGAAL
jgi:predicted anti-sigma-YlaC factor YlaD